MEELFITPKIRSETQFRSREKPLWHVFIKLHLSHPLNYPSLALMLNNRKAFSAVKQKGRPNKVASQEADKGSTVTEGNKTSHHSNDLEAQLHKALQNNSILSELIRKYPAHPAVCVLSLIHTHEGTDHSDHCLVDSAASASPCPRETGGALTLQCYATRVPHRNSSAAKFLGPSTPRPSIKISSKGIPSAIPTL